VPWSGVKVTMSLPYPSKDGKRLKGPPMKVIIQIPVLPFGRGVKTEYANALAELTEYLKNFKSNVLVDVSWTTYSVDEQEGLMK